MGEGRADTWVCPYGGWGLCGMWGYEKRDAVGSVPYGYYEFVLDFSRAALMNSLNRG